MKAEKRVYSAHTINTVAISIIGIYIPAYLLTLGYPLWQVILFYVISHGFGLIFAVFIFNRLLQTLGLLNTFKLYYPLEIACLILLSILKIYPNLLIVTALFNGLATFIYWIPMNMFLIRQSQKQTMGSTFAKFFAFPNLFGILGPIVGAILVPRIGFWPVFAITTIGLFASFIPLASMEDTYSITTFNFSSVWKRLKRHKILFVFEFLENIIEESEWFWSIYVFVIIGSLATPGIIGSLEAIGGSLFTLFIGTFANRYGKKLIPVAACLLFLIILARIFTSAQSSAYVITLSASFALTFFLVSYFSTMYKTVKNDYEEEFMILREIPTTLGRMVVFSMIFLTIHNLKFFFLLPLVVIILLLLLYAWRGKHLMA